MKKIIALVAAFASVSSFALNSSDSWETIQATVSSSDKYTASNVGVFLGKPSTVFDVCTDGENLVGLKATAVRERQYVGTTRDINDNDNDGYATVITGYKKYSYPITYTDYRRECSNNGKRCQKVPFTVNQKTVRTITINKLVADYGQSRSGRDRKVFKKLFSKTFEVPACN